MTAQSIRCTMYGDVHAFVATVYPDSITVEHHAPKSQQPVETKIPRRLLDTHAGYPDHLLTLVGFKGPESLGVAIVKVARAAALFDQTTVVLLPTLGIQ